VTVYIGVVGAGSGDAAAESTATRVGTLCAEAGAVVVTGGLGGVMEAASRGAQRAGGMTVGILPTAHRMGANEYLTVSIPTGLGEARNALVVRASDALIAIGGEWGTLSEIAFALKLGVPVIGIDTWELSRRGSPAEGIIRASDAAHAVRIALAQTAI
jgi:uncharacterized protein (TIGR00725 family)